ncbi:MAG: hypothetical protein LBR33_01155 [Propionibacteriaceae bacterium]|jgi:hypothetical protein|nr:hypothetical protein [Propionibacteriaceae bacterium]
MAGHLPPRARGLRRGVAVALGLALAAAATAAAFWGGSAAVDADGLVLQNGDLRLELGEADVVGDPVLAVGDAVVLAQAATATLVGDHLCAALVTTWDTAGEEEPPAGLATTVTVVGSVGGVPAFSAQGGLGEAIPIHADGADGCGPPAPATDLAILVTVAYTTAPDLAYTTDLSGTPVALPGLRFDLVQIGSGG